MCGILAGSTPGPSSSTCSSTVSLLTVRVTMIVPPLGEKLTEMQRRVAHELAKIGRQARRLDQLGGADVMPLGGDHQVEQAGERGIDDLERAFGARIVERHGASHRLEGRAYGGERRFERMRLVLGVLAD